MTNLDSVTELTEFAPLSPEIKQSSVSSYLSKFFKFSQDNSSNNGARENKNPSSFYVPIDKDEPSGDSKWDSKDQSEASALPAIDHYQHRNNTLEPRNLPNVLHRVSSLLALRHKNSPNYKDTNFKQYWMPDSVSKECYDCGEKFTTFRRRHHCRVCGQIFCSQCCNQEVPGKILGCSGNLRVCTYCCKVVLSYLQSADIEADLSADLKALQDDLQSKFGHDHLIAYEDENASDTCSISSLTCDNKRKISVVYQEEKFATGGFANNSTKSDNGISRNSELSTLNTLLQELCFSENALPIRNHTLDGINYESSFSGSQLIDWLISQRKTSSRTHSIAICQVLLDAKYIENLTQNTPDFIDGSALYKFCPVSSTLEKPKDNANVELSSVGPTNSTSFSNSGFQLDLNIHKNTVHIFRQPQKSSNGKDKKKSTFFAGDDFDEMLNSFVQKFLKINQLNPIPWNSVDMKNLNNKDNELATFSSLNDSFQQHLQNTVHQLLASENLSLSWSQIIIPLVEVALKEIKIDFSKTDVINIGHYVQVKKISGGEKKDSCLVPGIVCTKNVAHKGMSTRLSNPRILLLQCSIVYQRIEGKLMSLEPVMMQEQEYLRKTVTRIAALGPDLILVHRNVSRLAQELLNSLGITLVLNVKMEVMERIARCTNADILTAIDAHVRTTQLGTCRSFYIQDFALKNGATKTLMFFESCAFPQLGCTLLLRGASENELKKLKTVVNATVFMYNNAKLEKSFLMDAFAKPPIVPSFTFVEEVISPKHATAKNLGFVLSKKKLDFDHENQHESGFADKHEIETINIELKTTNITVENQSNKNIDNEPENVKPERKVDIEEKRTSTKSVVNFDDPLCVNSKMNEQDDRVNDEKSEKNYLLLEEVPLKQNHFRAALQDTVLSYSPYIVFNLPYLETKAGRNCELRKYFPKEIYYFADPNDKKDMSRVSVNECSTAPKCDIKPPHPLIHAQLKDDIMNEEVQTLLAFYRATGGRYSITNKTATPAAPKKVSIVSKPIVKDILDPRNHQFLPVLFCSFSHISNNAPEFCVKPWIVTMGFYGCNDITLGSFLEKYCFRKSYICPSKTCETSMIDHERRFVHDAGCIHITLQELDSLPEKKLPILFWSSCTVCKSTTPIVAMSNDTWSLSFAKYLELRFHARKYTCRVDNACDHSLQHNYCQYFFYNNIIASFKYTDILKWEISLPPLILKINLTSFDVPPILEEVKKWSVMGHELFGSILEKLWLLDIECVATIQGVKKHLNKQQSIFKQKVDDIQVILTSPLLNCAFAQGANEEEAMQKELYKLEDSLVLMKKSVAEALIEWNDILTKLGSRKKDDKQKTKSVSSELIDNMNPGAKYNESYDDKLTQKRNSKDENVSEDTENQDSYLLFDKIDILETKLTNKDNSIENSETNSNQTLISSGSSDAMSNLSQTQTSDKLTVKTILSQFLPNTFQSNTSLLSNPINSDEHYILNISCSIPLVVYETEPSSIIAYALSSFHYQYSLEEIAKVTAGSSEQPTKSSVSKKESTDGISINSAIENLHLIENDEPAKNDATDDMKNKFNKTVDANHIEIQFGDSTANFNVKVYFAQQFKDLRSLVFPDGEDVYIRSLSRCIHWAAHGGKSGSTFSKTKDDRFILKEMARLEIQPFLEFAPHYFTFIHSCYTNQQPTLLGKIVGVYRVKYRNNISNQTRQSNLLVMENLFYMRDIIRKFDLKGSVRNRLVDTQTCREGELVLLDENLINMSYESPLYVYSHSKTVLLQAINNDVTFLASQSVMDYSLLVGLDEISQELVVGIIDYIRTFTWDKKLETFVKKSGILGGQGKLPTIVSPEEYKNRFITAMHQYFLSVPDQWWSFGKGFDY